MFRLCVIWTINEPFFEKLNWRNDTNHRNDYIPKFDLMKKIKARETKRLCLYKWPISIIRCVNVDVAFCFSFVSYWSTIRSLSWFIKISSEEAHRCQSFHNNPLRDDLQWSSMREIWLVFFFCFSLVFFLGEWACLSLSLWVCMVMLDGFTDVSFVTYGLWDSLSSSLCHYCA